MRRCAWPVAALALPVSLLAQLPAIQSYSSADGLAANQVNSIVADSHGFIWFCTPEGLSRFDGYRFVNFGEADGLPDRDVNTLLETRSGAYLAGTSRGLAEFHPGPGGKFTTYLPGNTPAENTITVLYEDSSGRIWCGTWSGLFELLSGHRFRRQRFAAAAGSEEHAGITDVLEDAGHRLWVATRAGIYVIGADGGTQHVGIHSWTQNVRALLLDHSGRIWAGTQDGLVLMRATSNGGAIGVERIYKEIGAVKRLDITSLAEGPDGLLWAGASAGIGQWYSGVRPGGFRMVTRAQGLTDRQVNSLATDRTGNMWAGTESAGVMRVQASGFTTFREQDGLESDRVWSLVTDHAGSLMAVTMSYSPPGAAVNLFDGARFHATVLGVFSKRVAWGHHTLLEGRNGDWWAATTSGLCRYLPGPAASLAGRQPQHCYARETEIFQIFEDSKGRVWASGLAEGANQLLRWDPATKAISRIADGPKPEEAVGAFAEDRQGQVWMGLFGKSVLLRYDGRRFTRYGRADGLPEGPFGELLVDKSGHLWFSSSSGLGVIRDPASARLEARVYKRADGLTSDSIGPLAEDAAGRIYAATWKGVDRLDPGTGAIKHFTSADGLARGNVKAVLRDGSGNLWFATTQGLSKLSLAMDRRPAIPAVRITQLRIGQAGYPASQVGETRISLGALQPSQNRLQVGFVGFGDEPEEHLRYSYKLAGADPDWQGPGRDHEVNYADLAPGEYQFLVRAVNSEGVASTTPAGIEFVILPPLWRRWWFEALALACAAGLVFAAYQRRLQQMTARVRLLYKERLDERTRIARELHDTLLQNLAGVSLQLEGVAKQIDGGGETALRIRAVRQQVDDSFTEARQKVMALRSPTLQDRDLPAALRESLERIAANGAARLEVNVAGEPRPLSEDVDEAVLRIGQEAVANAVRHADAHKIQVSLAYGRRTLRLRIQDDGRGFDLDQARGRVGHWGLRNMQERADRIGAEWKVVTAPAGGTVIEAAVHLPGN